MKFVYGKDAPIHMLDNWLKPHEHENILLYCEQAKYTYGEKDDENVAPTGMSAEIRAGELIYRFLFEMTQPLVPDLCTILSYRRRSRYDFPILSTQRDVDTKYVRTDRVLS